MLLMMIFRGSADVKTELLTNSIVLIAITNPTLGVTRTRNLRSPLLIIQRY